MVRGAFLEHLRMGVCGCDCIEHIYGWVWVGGCDCLEDISEDILVCCGFGHIYWRNP